MRYLFTLLLVPLLAIVPAQHACAWTADEIRAMPPYCAGRYALQSNPVEYKRWEAMYGPDFLHTHHLCDGIGMLDRYYKVRSAAEKNTTLNDAMGGLNYMVQHASPDFKLMPDVYLYRSQVFHLRNKPGDAIADLRKAVALNPEYARAYSQAANYLERTGQRDEALKLVSEGLRHQPGNTGLQRLYTKLGGKPPYPEPYKGQGSDGNASTESGDKAPKAPAESAPADQTSSTQKKPQTSAPSTRTALYDLSKNIGAGQKKAAITGAGAYIFVEVAEDPSAPDQKVRFRIKSQIPQPAARIVTVGIDLGSFTNLFTNVEVKDALLGKHYPLRRLTAPYSHAYLPGFSPDFMAEFTIDPKQAKMYDPRALPPYTSLTLVATLARGKTYEDVISAMDVGLRGVDGLRFGVIAHHLLGVRPDPTKTIMDDAGFVTGSLRSLTGPDVQQTSTTPSDQDKKLEPQEGIPQAPSAAVTGPAVGDLAPPPENREGTAPAAPGSETAPKPPIGTPSNPWCRFCP